MPEYVCQKRSIEEARPLCAHVLGRDVDRALGELLVEAVSPLALEVALSVEAELSARAAEADRLRAGQVERARYEAELAQRRYLQVDPDNRLVADSLEADWDHKLRALSAAQEEYERQRGEDGTVLTEERRAAILALATDFPRLWADPDTPQRERKRMVRLLIEDVTLLRTDAIAVHVRFRGGTTRSLTLPLPLSAPDLRRTDPAVVAEIDRLLDEHTEAEIVTLLNERGVRPGVGERFSSGSLRHLRIRYGLEERFTRLRRRGLLTLAEVSRLLGAHPRTVKEWAREGLIPSVIFDDRGQRLYERPAQLQQPCAWCGDPIPAKPSLRGGKRWCSTRCCYAAYRSRKRTGQSIAQQAAALAASHGSLPEHADGVQSHA